MLVGGRVPVQGVTLQGPSVPSALCFSPEASGGDAASGSGLADVAALCHSQRRWLGSGRTWISYPKLGFPLILQGEGRGRGGGFKRSPRVPFFLGFPLKLVIPQRGLLFDHGHGAGGNW